MRTLSGLDRVFSFTLSSCHVIFLLLGFLTYSAWGACFSEYHQKHELHNAGSEIVQHDVSGTFASILGIMLLAKRQIIRMIDDEKNIGMGKEDCQLVGEGFHFRSIMEMNSTLDNVAKLSLDMIVGNQIMVTGDSGTSLVDITYYRQMLSALDVTHDIDMRRDHALMFLKKGGEYIMTNVDNVAYDSVDLICKITQDFVNIQKILLPSLQELHRVFTDIVAASQIFPQVLDIAGVQECLGLRKLSFWLIMNSSKERLQACLENTGRREKRNLLALIDGSQIEIDSVFNKLDDTITVFNKDLVEIEKFNREVVSSYSHLQNEMKDVEQFVNSVKDVVILEEIKANTRARIAYYHRMRLTSAMAFNNIVLNSDTAELVRTINHCVFGELTCKISKCQISLNCGIAVDDNGNNVLEIHSEYATLHNVQGYLISCTPLSSTHIST